MDVLVAWIETMHAEAHGKCCLNGCTRYLELVICLTVIRDGGGRIADRDGTHGVVVRARGGEVRVREPPSPRVGRIPSCHTHQSAPATTTAGFRRGCQLPRSETRAR